VSAVAAPVVSFLSDFGLSDQYVGICEGVILRRCPDARVIHLTHGIDPASVALGARVLAGAMPFLPVGVHMAVVDPGVGSERRALALRSGDGRCFVGPDNGLLVPAAEACGGVAEAVHITNRAHMLEPVSRTFHGRDIFAPATGSLAAGLAVGELGDKVDPGSLAQASTPGFDLDGTALRVSVQHVDRFGNVQLSAEPSDLDTLFSPGGRAEVVTRDDRYYVQCAATFADVDRGELVLYEDSDLSLSIAVNQGNAAELLDVAAGDAITVEFDPRAD
jgi:S-adenosyl-L-methionine hydrolase (adenosine-forming)